jgi:Fur family transcriptional regulator, stress-responsive regulator
VYANYRFRISQDQELIQHPLQRSRFRDTVGSIEREEATISELVQRLRDRGWRLTAQRRVVAEVLAGEHIHLTADAVYSQAQLLLPEISLATVYNTLNELVDMGEVMEISTGDGPKRYDPNTTAAHHHLYCVGCGALLDVHPGGTETLELSDAEKHGFELLDVDIIFRGRCPNCRRPAPHAAPIGSPDTALR